MDEPHTIFWLSPLNDDACKIVYEEANNALRRENPENISEPWLRIGFDSKAKIKSRLVSFGRMDDRNDVILPKFSKTDQCYFDLHQRTGELILHDTSKNRDTELYFERHEGSERERQMHTGKYPRQCVVLLYREYIFEIRTAMFKLIQPKAPEKGDKEKFQARLTAERLDFVKNIPDDEKTFEPTELQLRNLRLQSVTTSAYSLRMIPQGSLKGNNRIRYEELNLLGEGGQGSVWRVVDRDSGEHYALKIVRYRKVPCWGINTESGFKKKLLGEVNLVKKASHDHIVPFLFHQGWEMGSQVELFMPVYQGNLSALIERNRLNREGEMPAIAKRMLSHIPEALGCLHALKIIHRDIKPPNILFRDYDFYLADFGIAKEANILATQLGTKRYQAPEVYLKEAQTEKMDIYSLGVDAWKNPT